MFKKLEYKITQHEIFTFSDAKEALFEHQPSKEDKNSMFTIKGFLNHKNELVTEKEIAFQIFQHLQEAELFSGYYMCKWFFRIEDSNSNGIYECKSSSPTIELIISSHNLAHIANKFEKRVKEM